MRRRDHLQLRTRTQTSSPATTPTPRTSPRPRHKPRPSVAVPAQSAPLGHPRDRRPDERVQIAAHRRARPPRGHEHFTAQPQRRRDHRQLRRGTNVVANDDPVREPRLAPQNPDPLIVTVFPPAIDPPLATHHSRPSAPERTCTFTASPPRSYHPECHEHIHRPSRTRRRDHLQLRTRNKRRRQQRPRRREPRLRPRHKPRPIDRHRIPTRNRPPTRTHTRDHRHRSERVHITAHRRARTTRSAHVHIHRPSRTRRRDHLQLRTRNKRRRQQRPRLENLAVRPRHKPRPIDRHRIPTRNRPPIRTHTRNRRLRQRERRAVERREALSVGEVPPSASTVTTPLGWMNKRPLVALHRSTGTIHAGRRPEAGGQRKRTGSVPAVAIAPLKLDHPADLPHRRVRVQNGAFVHPLASVSAVNRSRQRRTRRRRAR